MDRHHTQLAAWLVKGSRIAALSSLAIAAGTGACLSAVDGGPTGTAEERALERRMIDQAEVARERAELEAAGMLGDGGDGGGGDSGGGGSH